MNRWLPWFAAAVLWVGGFWLNTRQNAFPYYYHPDEPKKVEQILSGSRNFNHPLLLLNAVEAAWKMAGQPRERQRVVELGRGVAAAFCAFGTVFFFFAAWLWRGPVAGLATGVLLTLQHQIFELAHYFKEDPALYCGVGATCLALLYFEKNPGWRSALALAAAAGLAASGKYLGAIMLLPAIGLGWRKGVLRLVPALLGGAVLVFSLLNFRLFLELATFRQSFGKEMEWAVNGQKELTRSVPHAIYLNIFVSNTTPVLWALLLLVFTDFWRRRRAISPGGWCLLGTTFGWLLLLSFSPKTNDRYFLPLTGLVYLLAGGGAAWAWEHWRKPLVLALLLGGAAWEIALTAHVWKAFARDDRAELVRWIAAHIPRDATIAYDARVNLPDEEVYRDLADPLPQRLLRETFASEVGSIEVLRQEGVRYVIISESTYGRFFLDSLRPKSGKMGKYEESADFYRELKSRPPLWSRRRGTVLYLHPGIEVYALHP